MVIKNTSQNEKDRKIFILLKDLNSLETYVNDIFIFSPLPLCFVSPLGVILESNPAFVKISNFSFDEIIGKAVEKLFRGKEIEKLIEDTRKQGFVEGREMKFSPKGKAEIPAHVFTRTRKDEKGEKVGYFLALFDLTKIKKTEREAREALMNMLEDVEEARRKSEEEKNKTLAIITNFTDGILVFDKQNKLLLINSQAEDFFKIERKAVMGKSVSELSKAAILRSLVELYKKGTKGISRRELEIREGLILQITIVPVVIEKERSATLVILHDITREKLIEKMKTEFVSLAAHQLRTPLSAIKWTTRMVLDEELGKINKEQREFLEDSYDSNERMIALVNNLLNIARIEEGRYIYKSTLADMKKIVKDVVDSYKEEAKARGLKVEFKKPEKKLPQVMLDLEKMQIAIDNFVRNAIRYTLRNGKVTVSLKCDKEKIEFFVKDTGIGIPKDQQGRIFSKFFRAANVMRMETQGAGLGMFITRNIIEAHGGKIWFESELGKGTTFYFTIPIKKKAKRS